MAVHKLLAGAGVGAVLALGTMALPAHAASTQAPTSGVTILSCPSGAPAADPGYRCLSSYSSYAQCEAGILRNIAATPATSGYCYGSGSRWWGYVNIY